MSATRHRPPLMAALNDKAQQAMEIILHIGAQRTASTSFQAYLRANAASLGKLGIGVWGPLRTRHGGILSGVLEDCGDNAGGDGLENARRKIAKACENASRRGVRQLIVSDENMLGTVRNNLRSASLFPGAEARLARFAQAFSGNVRRVAISIRALDTFWASSLAFAVGRGHGVPDRDELARLAAAPRGWRDVIADVARAFPGAEIEVHPHEALGGRPEIRLQRMTGGQGIAVKDLPMKDARLWLNRAPGLVQLRRAISARGGDPRQMPEGDGRWQPFDAAQTAMLRESYADDLFWLHAGAEGMATIFETDRTTRESGPDQAGANPPGGAAMTRGRPDEQRQGRLARAG